MNSVAAFGESLRQQRYVRRLTQAQLAQQAGLSERAISDLERGLKAPQRATVRLLIDALALEPVEAEAFDLAATLRRPPLEVPAETRDDLNAPLDPNVFTGPRPRAADASTGGTSAELGARLCMRRVEAGLTQEEQQRAHLRACLRQLLPVPPSRPMQSSSLQSCRLW
jgi:transcriptional regulator with XRE-family HTH domain